MTKHSEARSGWRAWVLWLPGFLVALGAGAATAHGLFEVAVAASVPAAIAWIYPLITDGLALVAYGATARLHGSACRYAWAVVVLAAGLSGLAQAIYLAGGVSSPPVLRFGVGAWPAVAAAIVAHLLFLLGTHGAEQARPSTEEPTTPVQPAAVQPVAVQPVQRSSVHAASVQPEPVQASGHAERVQRSVQPERAVEPKRLPSVSERRVVEAPLAPRDQARAAARRYAAQHGGLPTVRQLESLAEVSRGTAANALQELRKQPTQLHVIAENTNSKAQP